MIELIQIEINPDLKKELDALLSTFYGYHPYRTDVNWPPCDPIASSGYSNSPDCPKCKVNMSAAGGILGTSLVNWRCWICGYQLEDAEFEIIEPKQLNEHKKDNR